MAAPRSVAAFVALAWMLSIVLPGIRVAATPNEHSVYPSYVLAGRCWTAGRDIYAGTGYRYSPLVATLFSLFGQLPDSVGAPLWHLLSAGVYVLGLAVWLRRFVAVADLRSRALFFLLVLPPSLASLNNGQANAPLLGLLLLALDGVLDKRWHRVSACIVLAGAFKIYPLLLGAVLVARYPRSLGLRLALWTAAALALPFLLQHPGYVLHEYQTWFEHLRNDDRQILPVPLAYRDLRLLLRTCGMPIGQSVYFAIQILAAGALVGIAALRRGAGGKERTRAHADIQHALDDRARPVRRGVHLCFAGSRAGADGAASVAGEMAIADVRCAGERILSGDLSAAAVSFVGRRRARQPRRPVRGRPAVRGHRFGIERFTPRWLEQREVHEPGQSVYRSDGGTFSPTGIGGGAGRGITHFPYHPPPGAQSRGADRFPDRGERAAGLRAQRRDGGKTNHDDERQHDGVLDRGGAIFVADKFDDGAAELVKHGCSLK